MVVAFRFHLLARSVLFLSVAVPITVIDLRSYRIPDALSLGGLGLLATVDLAASCPALLWNAAAAAFAFLLFWAVRALTGGLGFGDVKYAALLGWFAGPRLLPAAFFSAAAAGLVYALIALRLHRRKAGDRVAFGPFLSIGGLAAAACMILGIPR
jgi:prepilin signal peptidase PulO-like enzyme (type II secretory pathway)